MHWRNPGARCAPAAGTPQSFGTRLKLVGKASAMAPVRLQFQNPAPRGVLTAIRLAPEMIRLIDAGARSITSTGRRPSGG